MSKKKQQIQRRDRTKVLGSGVGVGHTPARLLPEIRLVDMGAEMFAMMLAGHIQRGTKVYKMGELTIIVSPPVEEQNIGYHLSISHPSRYPTWDEIAKARYTLLPDDIDYVMHLPKVAEYINLHRYCFQIHEDDAARRSSSLDTALQIGAMAASDIDNEQRRAGLLAVEQLIKAKLEELAPVVEVLSEPFSLEKVVYQATIGESASDE